MRSHLRYAFASLALLAPTASADLLVGRLIDTNGNPVAFGDLDFRFAGGGGGNPATVNEGTDALGQFAVTIAAGTYDIVFNPPPPPGHQWLSASRNSVAVLGTTYIGDIVVPLGATISGTVVDNLGVGVAGVNFDAFDTAGVDQAFIYGTSGVGGVFAFNVPAGMYTLTMDPAGVIGQTLAPQSLAVDASTSANLGLLTLQPGFLATALVRNATNLPIANLDLDVRDATTMGVLFTPGDKTNVTGLVDVVVPAGNYYFDFKATLATGMAPQRLGPLAVAATTSLGVVQLQPGILLGGTVRDSYGALVAGANLDLKDPVTGVDNLLVNDGTNANGVYSVRVAPGVYDLRMNPPGGSGLGSQILPGVALAANATIDAVLPPGVVYACFGDGSGTACPCGNASAVGAKAGCLNSLGTGGTLRASGAARLSADTFTLLGTQMANSSALYFQGTLVAGAGLGTVFGDGLRCAGGTVIRLGTKTNALGASSYPAAGDVPVSIKGLAVAGGTRVYQVWYRNAAAFCSASTFNLTNAAQTTWAP